MTPAGHLSISYISGKGFRNIPITAVVLGGILPDLDFIFIFFDWFNQAHRVVTHNLPFVLLFSITGFLSAPKERKKSVSLGLFIGGILHLLIDSVMDNNPSNGIGIAFLWPFLNGFFSPFNLLEVQNKFGWNEPLKMFRALLPTMLYELPFYIAAFFLYLKQRTGRVFPRIS